VRGSLCKVACQEYVPDERWRSMGKHQVTGLQHSTVSQLVRQDDKLIGQSQRRKWAALQL
jgi:hypothetical protein